MIKVTNLSFEFPQKDLYNNIYFEIADGEHAVLIGSNGTGKSTLINLIMNQDEYMFEGRIDMPDNIRIGYVSQYTTHEGNQGVYEFLSEPFTELLARADQAAMAMGEAEDMDAAYEEFQKLQDQIDAMDAYNYDTNIRKQLASAELDHLLDNTVDKISGGEYKLLSIIRNMLHKPQLLIMDEPDAFLDFENLVGLSKLINGYSGTMLVISHNRLLLGQCFDKVLHIENCELQEFPGTFAEYSRSVLETKTLAAEQAAKDEEWIAVQEKLLNNLRKKATMYANAKTGAQVKARATYLERLQKRKTRNPFIEDHNYDLHFPEVCIDTTGADEIIFQLKDYSLAYDTTLLEHVNLQIRKGEKVALVGANGTGKSSMLRDIVELTKATLPEASVAYFSQIYEDTEQLSGGEKNIKQLKEICESSAELLLLDEPTSHLDTYAQIALEKAIDEYQGTVFMVSHDFYTVVNCVDRILLIEDGQVKEMSSRAFRKRIYKRYFSSDVFEQEKQLKELEVRVNALLKKGNYNEAKSLLHIPEEE